MNAVFAERSVQIVRGFAGRRIAVVGDLMLDVYTWGKVRRISPEAPVPVLEVERTTSCLGGAANVMRNIATLGGTSIPFGLIGADEDGGTVRRELASYGIDSATVLESSRRTTRKQRIVAGAQQVLRVDYEDTCDIAAPDRERLGGSLLQLLRQGKIDAVILEDYGKGVLTTEFAQTLCDEARERRIPVMLDPKPGHLAPVRHLTVMKPNRSEAFRMAGREESRSADPAVRHRELLEVAEILNREWAPEYLIISLAGEGMALFGKGREMTLIPTRAREVFDVSGAGDTVTAAFTLSLIAGAAPEEAAEIANYAAGIVVGKVGTVSVGWEELLESIRNSPDA